MMNGDKHYNLTVSDDNGKSLTTTNVSTKHPDEIVRLMTLAGLAQAQQAPAPMPEPDCGCDGGGEVEVVGTVDESEYEPTGPQDMDLNDYSKKTAVSISRQGKRIQPSHGDNPLGYSLDEDDIFESLILEYKKFEEAADNPFAVGMAMAKKSTKDTPPLKKSTVNKAHDIAKAIQKNESVQKKSEKIDEAQLDEAPLLGPKGAIHRAAGAEQSDREYIEQRQFKDKWKKENPGKTWPGYDKAGFKSRYYKTESAQKKTKVKEDTQNFDLNELKIEYPKKKDTLGIPRDEMPQVKSAHYDELIDFFKRHGIDIEKRTVPAKTLRATQENFNVEKIVAAIERYFTLSTAKPIIVSSDNYVIDGHHRWLAAVNVGGDIDIMQANVRVGDLLSAIRKFPKTFTKDINQT